jgi:hypothetical protein
MRFLQIDRQGGRGLVDLEAERTAGFGVAQGIFAVVFDGMAAILADSERRVAGSNDLPCATIQPVMDFAQPDQRAPAAVIAAMQVDIDRPGEPCGPLGGVRLPVQRLSTDCPAGLPTT